MVNVLFSDTTHIYHSSIYYIILCAERFCVEPFGLLFDGISTYNASDISTRMYEAEITFTCEHGKRITDFNDEDREIPDEVYKCEWDGSWSPKKAVSHRSSLKQNHRI